MQSEKVSLSLRWPATFKSLLCLAFIGQCADGALVLHVTGGSTEGGPTTINATVGDTIVVTVDIDRDAGELLNGATVAFAVTDFGGPPMLGSSGVAVSNASMADSVDWDGTIWNANQSPFFSAIPAGGDQPDQSTLTISNGLLPPLPEVPADGVVAQYVLDLSGAAPGSYQLTPHFANASLFTNAAGAIAPASFNTATVNISPVPEPNTILLVGLALLAARGGRVRQTRSGES